MSEKRRSDIEKNPVEVGDLELHSDTRGTKETPGNDMADATDLKMLQDAFKRAAWYSLTLTAIVTVIGVWMLSPRADGELTKSIRTVNSAFTHVFLALCLRRKVLRILDLCEHVR